MKRFGNLWEKICDIENIREAHHNARKGKVHYRSVQRVDKDPEKYIARIHTLLATNTYKTSAYKVFKKIDNGKVRVIYALPYFPDRIVHHCIMQVLEPIWQASFIRDTYASLKNRGIHDGVSRMQKSFAADRENTQYCLKMDVQQFYPSIDHDLLKGLIRKKIKDKLLLAVLDEIIDSVPTGVPIGNYLSQYFGNLFLSPLDHAAKEDKKIKYYYRYCDDIVVLGKTKEELHAIKEWYQEELAKIKLRLKPNWQVFGVNERGIDFLGYRFYQHKTLVRKRIVTKFKSKTRHISKHWYRMERIPLLSSLMSYYGWSKFANAGRLFRTYVSPSLLRKVTRRCGYSKLNEVCA